MTGLDLFLIFLLATAAVIGIIRGLGMTALDVVAVYTAFLLVAAFAPHVALSLPEVGVSSGEKYAEFYLGSFVLLTIVLLIFSISAYSLLHWHCGMLDRLGGLIAGTMIGLIVCHAITAGLAAGDSQQVAAISGPASQQLLTFSGFHEMVYDFQRAIVPKQDV